MRPNSLTFLKAALLALALLFAGQSAEAATAKAGCDERSYPVQENGAVACKPLPVCGEGEYIQFENSVPVCKAMIVCGKGQVAAYNNATKSFTCETRVVCNQERGEMAVFVRDPATGKSGYECQKKCTGNSTYYFDGTRVTCVPAK